MVSTVRTGKEDLLLMPRRSNTEKRWTRGFLVAFLAITAAIMFIAQPVAMAAGEGAKRLVVDVKDGDKVKQMEIWHDSDMTNVVAIVDGQALKVSDKQVFPIKLGEHTKRIVAIHPGPVIVFEGSWCALIGGRWIAYPPDSVCP